MRLAALLAWGGQPSLPTLPPKWAGGNVNVNTRVGGYTRCRERYVTLAAAATSANSRSTGTLERLYTQPPTLAILGVDSVAADVHIAGYTRGRRRALTLAARAGAANTRWRLRWCREPCAIYAAV